MAQMLLQGLAWITFAVAIVLCPVAWVRIIRAKTRSAYWTNIGLFAAPILLAFLFAELGGLRTGIADSSPAPPVPSVGDLVERMPAAQLALLITVGVLWIGGGNLLFHLHNRRLGKRWWQAMNPLNPPFKDFNPREWVILGALLAASLGLVAVAPSFENVR